MSLEDNLEAIEHVKDREQAMEKRVDELERQLSYEVGNLETQIEAAERRAYQAAEKLDDKIRDVEFRLEGDISTIKGDITDLERGMK